MFSSGFAIFAGFGLLMLKLPLEVNLRMLGKPFLLDLGASVLAAALHWGTFSGMMAAAVAGLLMSIATTFGRKLFGYIEKNRYYPGRISLAHKLKRA